MVTVYFDDVLRTKKKGTIPYWDSTRLENDVCDNQLVWFHECYGVMKLYRLLKVDEQNYIADDLHIIKRTVDPNWNECLANPEKALAL